MAQRHDIWDREYNYAQYSANFENLTVKMYSFDAHFSLFKRGGPIFALSVDHEKCTALRSRAEARVREEMKARGMEDWETRKIPLVEIKRIGQRTAVEKKVATNLPRLMTLAELETEIEAAAKVPAPEPAKPEPVKATAPKPSLMRPPAPRPPAPRKAA